MGLIILGEIRLHTHTHTIDFVCVCVFRPAVINNQVQPACLPKKDYIVPGGTMCYVTGWGRTQGTFVCALVRLCENNLHFRVRRKKSDFLDIQSGENDLNPSLFGLDWFHTVLIILETPWGEILRGDPDRGRWAVILWFFHLQIIAPIVVAFSFTCLAVVFEPIFHLTLQRFNQFNHLQNILLLNRSYFPTKCTFERLKKDQYALNIKHKELITALFITQTIPTVKISQYILSRWSGE